MASIRDWLQLFRSHTSPLEMTITITGSALAVGTIFDLRVMFFLIFGWIYHNAGYGQNSVEDYIQGFDKDDPNKVHHPLQRRAIDPKNGRLVCHLLILFLFFYGLLISELDILATILLVLLIGMGIIYNMFNKKMAIKFVPIAIAHSLLFPFAFFASGGEISTTSGFPFLEGETAIAAIVIFGYLILQIIYQIMIEGDLKDIDMDEASLLKKIGAGVKDGQFRCSFMARVISVTLKITSIAVLFLVVRILDGSVDNYIGIAVVGLLLLFFDHQLMRKREWDHSKVLKTMSLMEVVSTFALAIVIAPEIGGWIPAVLIMTFNMVYFVLMNRFLWGTVIKPRV